MTQGPQKPMFAPIAKAIVRAFLIVAMLGPAVKAVTLDAETHDVLIAKLGEVRANLSAKDSSFAPTSLRMADLLADRARLRDMDSMEKKGELSQEARQDRRQAIALIEQVMGQLPKDQRVRANLQRAQLYQLLDQSKTAEKLLVEIRKTQKGTEEYWTATDLLADLNFAIGEYKTAEKMYNEIQSSKKKNAFAQYRLAWCSLHQGHEQDAVRKMEALLKNAQLDSGLRIEAARDMAIFYARVPFRSNTIQKVLTASGPDAEAQKSNLKLFAEELKRTGQKKESALVFLSYLQMKSVSEEETIASQAELFENLVHIQRNREALPVLEKIATSKCDSKCEKLIPDVQMRVHKTLRNWAALEKTKPSPELLRAFTIFGGMKPLEQNALLFGIKTAQDAGQHKASLELLAILIANTRDEKVLEQALLANIQSAEKSKAQDQILAAYDLYLAKGKDAKLKSEIQLQRVQSLLALGKNKEAEESATALYRSTKDQQMGELLLGIFQRTKQTEKERLLSLDLAKGKTENSFYRNYKRLTLDLTKKRLEANLVDAGDYDMMVEIAARSKDRQEKYKILSDAYLVALKIENFDRLKRTAELLVETARSLGPKERALAVEKRIFVADLELDFRTSAALEKKNQAGKAYDADAAFRLVLKSRLAGRPELALEKKILRDNRAALPQRVWILQNQIQTAKRPFTLLRENAPLLSSRRELNARFALMALAEGRESDARAYLKSNPSLKRTVFGVLMDRRDSLVEMTRAYRAAVKTPVAFGSMNAFNRTLDARLNAMNKFERKYLRQRDSVLNLVAQGYMSGIHLTLANDLDKAATRVPAPASMRKDFQAQLTGKAQELRASVAKSEEQMENNWTRSGFEQEINVAFDKAHPLQRKALLKEIALWKTQSYGVIQKSWSRLERAHARGDESSSLASLYAKVQKNPFRAELSKELARAEEDRGNHVLSAFISARERQLGGI